MRTRSRRGRHYSTRRKFNRHGQSQPVALPFGVKVGLVAVIAFLGVLYSERIPPTMHALIRNWNGHQRENAPPVGAYYSNCDDARAAGVAPLYASEPGYRLEMDGDGDGVACEPYYN